jgi:DNA-binding transcriptional LysR family regulator
MSPCPAFDGAVYKAPYGPRSCVTNSKTFPIAHTHAIMECVYRATWSVMDIDPRLLRIFVIVMRCGSATRAAEELNTTQPSISKALHRLERAVGFRLFERRGRTLYPTAKAQLIREDALRLERELEAIGRRISEIRRGREAGFSVASNPVFATTILPRAIVELRRSRPKSTLKVEVWRTERILGELDAGRVDIGLIHSSTENVPSGFRIVANAPLKCVLVPEHPLCSASVITAQDLCKEGLIVYHNSLEFADSLWRLLENLDPMPEIIVEASQSALLRDLVRHRVGIALLDGFTAADTTLNDIVVRPFQPSLPFHLAIASRGSRLSADAREFLSILKTVALDIAGKA